MKATMLFKGMATMLVMTLIFAATSPVLGGEEKKATGEDLKNHLDEKGINVKEIVEMEARYKGKNGRCQNKNFRCWLFGTYYNCNSNESEIMFNVSLCKLLTKSCNVY